MKKIIGYIFVAVGVWCLIVPQTLIGLKQLKFLYKYAFPGEVLLGILLFCVGYHLIEFNLDMEKYKGNNGH